MCLCTRFSIICYFETLIVFSCNSSTEETQIIIIELLTRYIVYSLMYVIALKNNPPNPIRHTTLWSCLLKAPFLDVGLTS